MSQLLPRTERRNGAPAPNSTPAQNTAPINLLDIASRRKRLIAIGLVIGLAAGAVYYTLTPPLYQSGAQVLVVTKTPGASPIPGAEARPSHVENYLSAHEVLLRSRAIVERAVEKGSLHSLKSLAGVSDPTAAIIKSLKVSQNSHNPKERNAAVLHVSYRGAAPEEGVIVLNSVIASFKEFLDSTYPQDGDRTKDLYVKWRDEVSQQLADKQRQYDKIFEDAPWLWKGEQGVRFSQSLSRERLARIESEQVALALEEQTLRKRYGERHPEIAAARGRADSLTELWNQENAKAKATNDQTERINGLRAEIDGARQMYGQIVKQLQAHDMLSDTGTYHVRVISPPIVGAKVAPRGLAVVVAGFMGLLAGMLLAYRAEHMDQSFHTVEDIHEGLGLPVVGLIPDVKPGRQALRKIRARGLSLNPILCTFYRSQSIEAEAYRRVRTALFFGARGQGRKIVQVTSPGIGDGKSTLAANLAVSMAQSGKRVVLIDADLTNPSLQKIFGLSAREGLSSVLAGQMPLDEAIQHSGVPGLDILPCGAVPPNPAELLTSSRFEDLLATIGRQADFVLLDTAPLLVSTHACVVAPRVDGVLMAIDYLKTSRPEAEDAKRMLASLNAAMLGVVVNKTGRRIGYGGQGDDGRGHYVKAHANYDDVSSFTLIDEGEPETDLAVPAPNGKELAAAGANGHN